MEPQVENGKGGLNEHQKRHLRITCQYVDKLLADIEGILNSSTSKAAFPRFIADVTPTQRRTIEDYIARIRAQLLRVLEGQGVELEPASIPASRAVHVNLGSIDIALYELKPRYMRGYGAVPEDVGREVEGIVGELQGLAGKLNRFVLERAGEDFQTRLKRLAGTIDTARLLAALEHAVTGRGLVEFRPALASILDRIEERTFEIAVFGRVSSGKSSLLNAILGSKALPVGVTPITAVPTRIRYAKEPKLTVWYADRPMETAPVDALARFATEQENAGNKRHVSRLLLELPSATLREGVTFVDTPGLGSLATGGAEETLAYLPRCDAGVLLIDAGATLTEGDLETIEALGRAGVPAQVVLSKADLLAPGDLERVLRYTRESIATQCGAELPVVPVSALPEHRSLLDRWFETEIFPLLSRASELREISVKRKIGALRESVAAALRVEAERERGIPEAARENLRQVESTLRKITGEMQEAETEIRSEIERMGSIAAGAIEDAAQRMAEEFRESAGAASESTRIVHGILQGALRAQAQRIHERIKALAREVSDGLRTSAQATGMAEPEHGEESGQFLRGMPVFGWGTENWRCKRPWLGLWLGRGIARRQISLRMRREVGARLLRETETYAAILRVWCDWSLGQMRRWFDSHADSYRAQAGRLLTTEGVGGAEELWEELRQLGDEPMEARGSMREGR